jgi:hypothetical protein
LAFGLTRAGGSAATTTDRQGPRRVFQRAISTAVPGSSRAVVVTGDRPIVRLVEDNGLHHEGGPDDSFSKAQPDP